jgi:hypothetical protein
MHRVSPGYCARQEWREMEEERKTDRRTMGTECSRILPSCCLNLPVHPAMPEPHIPGRLWLGVLKVLYCPWCKMKFHLHSGSCRVLRVRCQLQHGCCSLILEVETYKLHLHGVNWGELLILSLCPPFLHRNHCRVSLNVTLTVLSSVKLGQY